MPGAAGAATVAVRGVGGLSLDVAVSSSKEAQKRARERNHNKAGRSSTMPMTARGERRSRQESPDEGTSRFGSAPLPNRDGGDEEFAAEATASGDGMPRFDIELQQPPPGKQVAFRTADKFLSDDSDVEGSRSRSKNKLFGSRSMASLSLSSSMYQQRSRLYKLVTSPHFDAVIGVVIFFNAVIIGIEQQMDLDGSDTSFIIYIEHGLLAFYVIELGTRLYAIGPDCIRENWWRFDALLVSTSVVCFWIVVPIYGQVKELETISMLRMLRLLRLARAVRMVWLFRELWMLVQGLLVSGRTILYTVLLIGCVLYLYAVVLIELITNSAAHEAGDADPEFQAHVQLYFYSLPGTMLTLLQFVSFDNVVQVYEPFMRRDWKFAMAFLSIIVLVGVLLMNLVTAVVVNSALETAMADKEMAKAQEEAQKKKLIKELRKVFLRLDDDGSGQVTKDEIEKIQPEDREMLQKMLGVSDPMELFNALDADGSGEVDIDEFCNGVWAVCISKSPIELKRTEKMVEYVRDQLRASEDQLTTLMHRIEALQTLAGTLDEKLEDKLDMKSRARCAGSLPPTPKSRTAMDLKDGLSAAEAKLPPALEACVKSAMRELLTEAGVLTALAAPKVAGAQDQWEDHSTAEDTAVGSPNADLTATETLAEAAAGEPEEEAEVRQTLTAASRVEHL